jgi:hypothetical protein
LQVEEARLTEIGRRWQRVRRRGERRVGDAPVTRAASSYAKRRWGGVTHADDEENPEGKRWRRNSLPSPRTERTEVTRSSCATEIGEGRGGGTTLIAAG